jgi:hypothetical protein
MQKLSSSSHTQEGSGETPNEGTTEENEGNQKQRKTQLQQEEVITTNRHREGPARYDAGRKRASCRGEGN